MQVAEPDRELVIPEGGFQVSGTKFSLAPWKSRRRSFAAVVVSDGTVTVESRPEGDPADDPQEIPSMGLVGSTPR